MTNLLALDVLGYRLDVAVERLGRTTGSPVVLLHGLGSSATRGLRHIAENLEAAGLQPLLVDLPGFGESAAPAGWPSTIEAQADVVSTVLDHLGLRRVAVSGHSMGGSVAIVLAWRRPDLVARLVVAEPLLDPAHGTLSAHVARQTEVGFVRRGFAALKMATRRQAARGDVAATGFLRTLAVADPVMLHRSAVSLLATRTPSFDEQLRALNIPRTYLAGARSGIDAAALRDAGVKFRLIPDAGHAMMDENPGAYSQAIMETVLQ